MNIFTVTTDDKNGHECRVFTDRSKADAHAWAWLKEHWSDDFDGPMPDNLIDAMTKQQDGAEYFIYYELHNETSDLKAIIGRLLEQIYQMQGMFGDEDGTIAAAVAEAEAAI